MGKRLANILVLVLAAFFFIASFLILYHQKVTFGRWFQFQDVLHHETFALVLFALALGVIIGAITYAVVER